MATTTTDTTSLLGGLGSDDGSIFANVHNNFGIGPIASIPLNDRSSDGVGYTQQQSGPHIPTNAVLYQPLSQQSTSGSIMSSSSSSTSQPVYAKSARIPSMSSSSSSKHHISGPLSAGGYNNRLNVGVETHFFPRTLQSGTGAGVGGAGGIGGDSGALGRQRVVSAPSSSMESLIKSASSGLDIGSGGSRGGSGAGSRNNSTTDLTTPSSPTPSSTSSSSTSATANNNLLGNNYNTASSPSPTPSASSVSSAPAAAPATTTNYSSMHRSVSVSMRKKDSLHRKYHSSDSPSSSTPPATSTTFTPGHTAEGSTQSAGASTTAHGSRGGSSSGVSDGDDIVCKCGSRFFEFLKGGQIRCVRCQTTSQLT